MKLIVNSTLILIIVQIISQTNGENSGNATRSLFSAFGRGIRLLQDPLANTIRGFTKTLERLDPTNLKQLVPFFGSFAETFGKKYFNESVKQLYMAQFAKNILDIKNHNMAKGVKFLKGINELSDLKFSDVRKYKTGLLVEDEDNRETDLNLRSSLIPEVKDLPKEWDWRKFGIITPPENQGMCDSCWAFTGAAALESHNNRKLLIEGKFKKDLPLVISPQNFVDCVKEEKYKIIGDSLCAKGMTQWGWKWVQDNGGVMSLDQYPYKAAIVKCEFNPSKKIPIRINSFKRLKSGLDKQLETAIFNYGPVAVAIALTKDMQSYKSGVFDDPECNTKRVEHAVLAVGYAADYFIIKNSWGPNWGEDGFMRISRNRINNCAVSQQPYLPLLEDFIETDKCREKFV